MTLRVRVPRPGVAAALVLAALIPCAARAAAQPATVESDPIKCWWKTDKNAVHVGERFALVLTCAVIETSRLTVVPAVRELEPGSVQLMPFEVVEGARHEDIRSYEWRYFQFQYTLRLVGEEFFGADVAIPPLKITYTVRSAQGTAALEGRDRVYTLPALPIRLMSLVPRDAADIRDAWRETFGDIERRRFRSNAEFVAAAISVGLALVMLAVALVRATERYRRRGPRLAPAVGTGAVVRACRRELGGLKADVAREGWTPARAGRALAIVRLAGAVALGRPVAQAVVPRRNTAREGQLVARAGLLRRRTALVSASLTADALARHTANGNGRGRATLEDLSASSRTFTAARYGRNGQLDTSALDRALEQSENALKRLRIATLWPVRTILEVGRR